MTVITVDDLVKVFSDAFKDPETLRNALQMLVYQVEILTAEAEAALAERQAQQAQVQAQQAVQVAEAKEQAARDAFIALLS